MTFHPWRLLRHLADIVYVEEPEDGLLGSWDATERRIRLHPRLSQVQRRCTVAHELIHAELGHDGPQNETTEAMVHAEAARRLIGLEELARALLTHDDDLHAAADHLWVDVETLQARLDPRFLHPSDRGYLMRRLAMKEQTA